MSVAYPRGIKLRTVTDGGAIRKRKRGWQKKFTNIRLASIIQRASMATPGQVVSRAAQTPARSDVTDTTPTTPTPGDNTPTRAPAELRDLLRGAGITNTAILDTGEVKVVMASKGIARLRHWAAMAALTGTFFLLSQFPSLGQSRIANSQSDPGITMSRMSTSTSIGVRRAAAPPGVDGGPAPTARSPGAAAVAAWRCLLASVHPC